MTNKILKHKLPKPNDPLQNTQLTMGEIMLSQLNHTSSTEKTIKNFSENEESNQE